jgi:4-amino-4-deoxy-L-arabinose transferase-like glycosyltransferase
MTPSRRPAAAGETRPTARQTPIAPMTASQQTDAIPAPPLAPPVVAAAPATWRAALLSRTWLRHLALAPVLALSAVLNINHLSQNGYANIFYSAGVRSMLHSLHSFAFVSFDPGGLVMVDKPPLGLWVQVASAKLFGFAPLSLLLPEAILGVLTVALLYYVLARRFGWVAALAGALALAVFPSFVAVSRDNGVDPLLILLLTLSCAAALWATESGRWRAILACAALIGLAFNTKTLASVVVIPGIALAYALCAPGSVRRRLLQLGVAGVLMVVVAFSWIAFVELTPASKRPFVGGSKDNTELGLTFVYNGFGRVGGQEGGPGRVPRRPGAIVHTQPLVPAAPGAAHTALGAPAHVRVKHRAHRRAARVKRPRPVAVINNSQKLIPFGGPTGPLRLFDNGLGDQGGWFLPFALVGALALACWLLLGGRAAGSLEQRRRDPRLAALIVLGGWFAVEALLLSFSKGIVHPYYVSALGPGAAAMAGVGVVAFGRLAAGSLTDWRRLLAPAAIGATLAAQIVLLHREGYLHWFVPLLFGGGLIAMAALLLLRRATLLLSALTLALLLVAPTAYSTTTWHAPVEGTFPAAGPHKASGRGGVGLPRKDILREHLLAHYVLTHGAGTRWAVLADASNTSAPLILMGVKAGALAGYSGTDPAVNGRRLAGFVARHEARYVVIGGEFSTRGGNRATAATIAACRELAPEVWQGAPIFLHSLVLFDCAGRERQLAAEPRVTRLTPAAAGVGRRSRADRRETARVSGA